MTKVIKVEDIDPTYGLSTAQGLQKKSEALMSVDLWNSEMSQIVLQFTDLRIEHVDQNSRIYLSLDSETHRDIINGLHHLENASLQLFTKIMSRQKVKGDFTFSSILGNSDDNKVLMALDTRYSDYETTIIGVTPKSKVRIGPNDLILSEEEKSRHVGQVCSLIVELMGINLDVIQEPAHISLEYRLRIMKTRKVILPIRKRISDPSILDEPKPSNVIRPDQEMEVGCQISSDSSGLVDDVKNIKNDTLTQHLSNLIDDSVLQDVDALVDNLGTLGSPPVNEESNNNVNSNDNSNDNEEASEHYVDVLNEQSESDEDNGTEVDEVSCSLLESDGSADNVMENLAKIVQDAKDVEGDHVESNNVEDLDELDEQGHSINNDAIVETDVLTDEEDEDDIEDEDDEEDDEDEDDEDEDEEDDEEEEEEEDEDDIEDDDIEEESDDVVDDEDTSVEEEDEEDED